MTTEELCSELDCPPELPAGSLLAAWERRRAELDSALADTAHARPVKLRLREQRRRLDAAESLAAALKQAAEIDTYFAEFDQESAKPSPSPGLQKLFLEKARPLIERLTDAPTRFGYEKRLAAAAEQVRAVGTAGAAGDRALPVPPDAGGAATPCPPHASAASARPLVLELIPVLTGETLRNAPPRMRFVAADTFTIGRQSTADCALRYALDTEENRGRLSTISRIHTRLTARGGRLFVADGPSRNGTFVDEQRLTAGPDSPLALDFAKERRFTLGQFGFELRVQYFAEGFVRFLLPAGADRGTQPVWLLAAAPLGSSPTAAIRLDPSFPPVVARISHHATRGFSLDLPDAPDALAPKNHLPAVCLNGETLRPGSSSPLQPAQTLTLGHVAFTVHFG